MGQTSPSTFNPAAWAQVLFRLLCPVRRFQLWLLHRDQKGPGRLLDSLFLALPAMPVRAKADGLTLQLHLNDPSHYSIALGRHEKTAREWLLAHVRPGMVAVDVGANIGHYTCLLAQAVGPEGLVVALEPDTRALASLLTNLEANGCRKQTDIYGDAAYLFPGLIPFGVARTASRSNVSCLEPVVCVTINCVSLDELAERLHLTQLDVLKIDTAGTEGYVLAGAKNVLAKYRPILLVELHDPQNQYENHPVVAQVQEAGYTVTHLTPYLIGATPK